MKVLLVDFGVSNVMVLLCFSFGFDSRVVMCGLVVMWVENVSVFDYGVNVFLLCVVVNVVWVYGCVSVRVWFID